MTVNFESIIMMVCMNRLYISLIGKSMKHSISHQSIALEPKQLLNHIVMWFLLDFYPDFQIKNTE